ncbi:MAG: hypothetical protein AB8G77_00950 [Rhodothermales bacterium]
MKTFTIALLFLKATKANGRSIEMLKSLLAVFSRNRIQHIQRPALYNKPAGRSDGGSV